MRASSFHQVYPPTQDSGSMSYVVMSKDAPEPIGPYSQAVISDKLVFCSGQLGIDPRTGKMVEGGSAVEARRCLKISKPY